MTLGHRIRFYQQLAVLARAGVPLRSSLTRLEGRISGSEMRILAQRVNAGEHLGDAFIAAGFSPFECHLVAAGERSARLETVFQHLTDFWLRQRSVRDEILRPLYYPIIVFHMAILLGSAVDLATHDWPWVVAHFFARLASVYFIGFVIYAFIRFTWASDAGRRFYLLLPLIGSTFSTAYAFRWITALRLEYSAGIPMPNAVADAWRASGFIGSETHAREGEQALREGMELSPLMQGWRQLPSDWIDFIETGEVSGTLETAFDNIEAEASRNWNQAQQRMAEWMPKILYFIVLLITAAQVAMMMYQAIIAPMANAENDVNKLLNGN